ncbi:MAG TPA: hypothetical protein VM470_00720, partial [Acidimicrobiia bacterium]|nr:hypothetical protein [Acidimicrobiia bacterium]
MSGRSSRRGTALILAVLTVAILAPGSASAVTKGQVESACASSGEAYDEWQRAQSVFRDAALAYEAAQVEVDNVLYRQQRTNDAIDLRRQGMDVALDQFEKQAVEAYMSAGSTGAIFFMAGSLDQVITASEFLTAAASDQVEVAGNLEAAQSELNGLMGRLGDLEVELRQVEAERLNAKDAQEEAM